MLELASRVREQSTALIAILTDREKTRDLEKSLTIEKIVDKAIPISVLKVAIGRRDIAIAMDVNLTMLVGSLNLKWNMNDSQIKILVEDLIDKYPNESLEDFILVFKRARQGEFGELYRLDTAIVFGWMEKHLEEKYQVIESKLMSEKENQYNVKPEPGGKDWLKLWLDEVEKSPKKGTAPLSREDVLREGQKDPLKRSVTSGYKYFQVRNIQIMAMTQEHAEQLVKRMIETGELEEDI